MPTTGGNGGLRLAVGALTMLTLVSVFLLYGTAILVVIRLALRALR